MKNIDFKSVTVGEGFWHNIFIRNIKSSIPSVKKQFLESGRFAATAGDKMPEGTYRHIYYDSDVYKWIEGVCDTVAIGGSLNEDMLFIDSLIDKIAKNQDEDGYFNSHFQFEEPENKFTQRESHELYCSGHLIEAAVAYKRATGSDKFLNVAVKLAACIEKYFVKEKTAKFSTPGHEEIEHALILLYEETKDIRWFRLSEHFLLTRGTIEEECLTNMLATQDQHDKPLYEIDSAVGHAVRAVYLYRAMAEYSLIAEDNKMRVACERVFSDIMKKIYVTGGIGSSRIGEAFTLDYDLPNLYAYSESCASIGLMFFAEEMQKFGRNTLFADVTERVMYNSFLSSTSLDGKSFFYENPLELCKKERDKEKSAMQEFHAILPISQRLEVFYCSCCPPNVNRAIPQIGSTIFSEDDNGIIINQFIPCKLSKYGIKIDTQYPLNGKLEISAENYPHKEIAVRKPYWCEKFTTDTAYTMENGYIIFKVEGKFNAEIDFDMKPRFWKANAKVRDDAGKVALCYGPMVYCIEECDNGEDLFRFSVDTSSKIKITDDFFGNMPKLVCEGYYDETDGETYQFDTASTKKRTMLTFIPYFAFANRGESDMCVWVRKA